MEQTQSLRDVTELNEEKDYKIANLYIQRGWELLSTHIADQGEPRQPSQITVYVLGWFGPKGEAPHPTMRERQEAHYGRGTPKSRAQE